MPTINELRSTHLGTVNALQRAISGETLKPEETLAACDLLAALRDAIPVDPVMVYRIEDGVRLARLRDGRDPSQHGDDPSQRDAAYQAAVARFAPKAGAKVAA